MFEVDLSVSQAARSWVHILKAACPGGQRGAGTDVKLLKEINSL